MVRDAEMWVLLSRGPGRLSFLRATLDGLLLMFVPVAFGAMDLIKDMQSDCQLKNET